MTALILLSGVVVLGASVQWLTGMGFALVAVPALILLLGPAEGVALANCAAGAISVVGLAGGWRRVRPAAMVPLCAAAACTVPAGAWLTRRLPPPFLLLTMGALVTLAVLLVMRGARLPALGGRGGALTAGAVGGFMNSAAGVGGPPISLYALNAGWTVREFVPNAQFYGVVVNAFSVTANGVPGLSAAQWTAVGGAMLTGGLAGRAVADRTPEHHALPPGPPPGPDGRGHRGGEGGVGTVTRPPTRLSPRTLLVGWVGSNHPRYPWEELEARGSSPGTNYG